MFTKVCPDCTTTHEFRQPRCRRCYNALYYRTHSASWKGYNQRSRATEGHKLTKREYQLLKRYGLTVAQYTTMASDQKGHCKICLQLSRKPLSVDHDHTTGKVRGLLCHKCNVGLGYFNDNPESLTKAIRYLAESRLT